MMNRPAMEHLDHVLFGHVYASAPEWIAVPITHLCTWGALWVLVSVALLLFGRGHCRRAGVALVAGLASSYLIVDLAIKPMVSRLRPCEVLDVQLLDTLTSPGSCSFPSGHASIAFVGAWILGAGFSLRCAYHFSRSQR